VVVARRLTMSTTVDCSKSLVGRVIGRGGETINDLQNKSATRIQIDQQVPEGMPCKITITGPPQNVQVAVQMVNEVMKNGPPRGGVQRPPQAPGYGAPQGYGAPPYGYPPPQGFGGYPPPNQFGAFPPQGYGGFAPPAQGYGGYPPPYGGPPTYPPQGFVPPPGPQGYGGQQQQQGPPPGFMQPPGQGGPVMQPPPDQQPGGPPGGGPGAWQEHKTGDGNSYWYNSQTEQSQWEKPAGV